MSPTYNDHFRQATKKVTKNIRFKCRRISLEVAGGCYYFTTFAMSHSVDWATLPGSAGATTISGKMSGTSWANIGNAFKAPSNGLYFASAIFNQNGNPGGTAFIMGARIVAAGNAFSTSAPSVANFAGNHNCTITLSRMTWLTAGQTIQMQGRTENWSGGVAGRMEVTRVY